MEKRCRRDEVARKLSGIALTKLLRRGCNEGKHEAHPVQGQAVNEAALNKGEVVPQQDSPMRQRRRRLRTYKIMYRATSTL